MIHAPVMLQEVLDLLQPKPDQAFIDGTVGLGGHAKAILEKTAPGGRLLAIDRDERNLRLARETLKPFGERVGFVHDSYANVKSHAYAHGMSQAHGILLDLGFSSAHVEDRARGFSFLGGGPLDMRYDTRQDLTAAMVINTWGEEALSQIFRTYADERYARQLAREITAVRSKKPIVTTDELAELVASVVKRRGKTHPATKVFQALRIAVNDELGELERALPDLVELLAPHGRLAIISFHSLEDRLVKQWFKAHEGDAYHHVNKRVIIPSEQEIKTNPRSRSAKLRVIEKH